MHALATTQAVIAQRTKPIKEGGHGEDTLTAAFWVVEAMDSDQCAAILREALGQPLCRDDADVVQLAAAKLGVTVGWKHFKLNEDLWGEGRGHE